MAKKLTSTKARKILHDKEVHGHPLTEQQRKFFGAIAGGAEPYKAQIGTMLTALPSNMMDRLSDALGFPQKAVTKMVTGKYQTPSEAMGITNPIGAFATDAVLDPVNLLFGAGSISRKAPKVAEKIVKKSPVKSTSKKPITYLSDIESDPRFEEAFDRSYIQAKRNIDAKSAIDEEEAWKFSPEELKRIKVQKQLDNEMRIVHGIHPETSITLQNLNPQSIFFEYMSKKNLENFANKPSGTQWKGVPRSFSKSDLAKFKNHEEFLKDVGKKQYQELVREYPKKHTVSTLDLLSLPKNKNGGWLDKYDAPQAQNGIEGTMGGLTDVGFNYNGAWGGTMQMGGSLPGAVGFTYARTQSPAPANGPYAKKTKASAQNGKYIKDKVKGIEDELQDRFIKPDLDKAFEKAKKRGINYGAHNGPLDAIRHATSASKVASSIPILGLPIANILGAAHEISANRGDKKELLSDLYNNFIGSVIGSVPFVSDDTRRKWVVDAQKSGILSTIDDTKKEPKKGPEFLRNNFINVLNEETKKLKEREAKLFDTKIIFEDGGSMKYYQEGLDFKPKTISQNGSAITTDINDYRRWQDSVNNYIKGQKNLASVRQSAKKNIDSFSLLSGSGLVSAFSNLVQGDDDGKRRAFPKYKEESIPRNVWYQSQSSVQQPKDVIIVGDPLYGTGRGIPGLIESIDQKTKDYSLSPYGDVVGIYHPPVRRSLKYQPPVKKQQTSRTIGPFPLPESKKLAKPIPIPREAIDLGYELPVPNAPSPLKASQFENKPTKFSFTYPTGKYNEQKTMYFPSKAALKSFVGSIRDASYQEGADYASATGTLQDGGDIPVDPMGYWNPENVGGPVIIPSNIITMEGVDQPLLGISDTGDVQYMEPGEDYEFDGEYVTEYPVAQAGRKVEEQRLAESQQGAPLSSIKKTHPKFYKWMTREGKTPTGVYGMLSVKDNDPSTYTKASVAYEKSQKREPIYVSDPKDPRLKAYQDSLYLYNEANRISNLLRSKGYDINKADWVSKEGNFYGAMGGDKSDIPNMRKMYEAAARLKFPKPISTSIAVRSTNNGQGVRFYDLDAYAKPKEIVDYIKPEPEVEYKPRPRVEAKLPRTVVNDVSYDLPTPKKPESSKLAKYTSDTPTQYSFTYPTGKYLEDKTIYFPTKEAWKSFVEKIKGTERFKGSEERQGYGKATGYLKDGGNINDLDAQPLKKLDQLLNFTNYNKPTKGGWLDKYN